jgi:hypothetical protein
MNVEQLAKRAIDKIKTNKNEYFIQKHLEANLYH